MTDSGYLTYQKFSVQSEAVKFSEFLTKHDIKFQVEEISSSLDSTFGVSELSKEFRIKIDKQDFEKVENISLSFYEKELESVDSGHYLNEFSDQELMEILLKYDEWSKFDYLLAKKLLKQRGNEISNEMLDSMSKQRITELSKPSKIQAIWIVFGYLLSLLGGLLGLVIGWHLLTHRKTLPNGEVIYGYSLNDQKHGSRILILGFVSITIWIISIIFKIFSFSF
jgi:hypothetical protein